MRERSSTRSSTTRTKVRSSSFSSPPPARDSARAKHGTRCGSESWSSSKMAEGLALSKLAVCTTRAFAAAASIALASASKRLATLARHGHVERLTRGVWIVPEHPHFSLYGCVPALLGNEIGYVSFLSALALHGMLS